MNYLMVDISGKVIAYDIELCEAIQRNLLAKDRLVFLASNINPKEIMCNSKKLVSLIPSCFKLSNNIFKRGIKALEGVVNYIYLILFLLVHKIDVLHMQWLPFLEICSVEKIFLCIIKTISPNTKIILTVHNLYPHDSDDVLKLTYRNRFCKVQKYIDKFVLHLEISRKEFCKDFLIESFRTVVIPHGILEPKGFSVFRRKSENKLNLIMYGNQSYYKGTDIFVDALNLLPRDCQEKVHATIVGNIASDYYRSLKKKTETLDVEWIPKFIPDDELYRKISDSDVIVIPYREISQSGVLLLALSFKRLIIASDLPSFKETLVGFRDDMFFENGNADSLAKVIKDCIRFGLEKENVYSILENLCETYSWEKIGKVYLNHVYSIG